MKLKKDREDNDKEKEREEGTLLPPVRSAPPLAGIGPWLSSSPACGSAGRGQSVPSQDALSARQLFPALAQSQLNHRSLISAQLQIYCETLQ